MSEMSSQGQEVYMRIDTKVFQETGEIKTIGEPMTADEVAREMRRYECQLPRPTVKALEVGACKSSN